ncbi:MAG: NAD(P)H-hydrate dehydratase, partial [Actinomycetota bacterium]
TSGEVLMERAGRAVARATVILAGGRYGRRVAVVCGKGNNGGDGFVVARVLRGEGLAVSCFVLADPDEFKGDAATHLTRMRRAGVRAEPFEVSALGHPDVVVDAIFGTGFRGTAEGLAAQAIEAINGCGAPVLAVDIPSGVDGATGAVEGPAVKAQATVTMQAIKTGCALHPGAAHCGDVVVADIGVEVSGASAFEPAPEDAAAVLPVRTPDSHKRSNGSVLLLAGSGGMSGAALLAARAAARTGAGYVTLVTTPYVDDAKRTLLPEVVSAVAEGDVLGPATLDEFKQHVERADAVAIGPGLGTGAAQAELMQRALAELEAPVVVDADGLNLLAASTGWLSERAGAGRATVITPHPGEMARLLELSGRDVQSDRLGAARRAADRFGCSVVLKGAGTVVARPIDSAPAHPSSPDPPITLVNPTGGPELATAGTGDVLTGVVAALAAAALDPFDAAWSGVFVHGLAGEAAARAVGRGVVAWDVAEALPRALAELGS